MLPYTFSKKDDNALLVLLGWSDFQMRCKQEPGLTILGAAPSTTSPHAAVTVCAGVLAAQLSHAAFWMPVSHPH